MSINFSWLDDFLALASSGNFSRAAEERHMTQPAFSRRIRALEEWLGTELFDRSSQPARLTAAGEWFRTTARGLQERVARVPGEAREVADAHATHLRFAATHALSFTFLPAWLRRLERRTVVGQITLVSDVLARCEALLLSGQVQFVISHAHPEASSELLAQGFPWVCVGRDSLMAVSAPGDGGAALHSAEAASPGSPLATLDYSADSGLARILREVRGGVLEARPCRSVFKAHLASVLRTMALDGRGMAWLPQTLIADDLAAGRLVQAAPELGALELEIRLYRDRLPLSEAAARFWAEACGE